MKVCLYLLKQLHHLGPANSDLHALEQQYSCMAKALDATRYDMACRRISPCSEGDYEAEITFCTLYLISTLQMN